MFTNKGRSIFIEWKGKEIELNFYRGCFQTESWLFSWWTTAFYVRIKDGIMAFLVAFDDGVFVFEAKMRGNNFFYTRYWPPPDYISHNSFDIFLTWKRSLVVLIMFHTFFWSNNQNKRFSWKPSLDFTNIAWGVKHSYQIWRH